MTSIKSKLGAALMLLCSACTQMDSYAERWQQVSIGDTRAAVQQAMGQPNGVHALQLPLVQVEQAVWKSLSGRTYIVHFVLDRAASKVVVQ